MPFAARDADPAPCVCLIVLDGWGIGPLGAGNAISLAHTPVFDELWVGLKALAGAGIVAAALMSMVALVESSESQEARAASQAAAQLAAGLPPIAKVVSLSVTPEYKLGPEGEKQDAFTVTEFSVRAGQPRELRIDNTDTVPHSITAPEGGINIVIMPGTHTYTLLAKQTGRFLWFCTSDATNGRWSIRGT
jgi:hypothetical protein